MDVAAVVRVGMTGLIDLARRRVRIFFDLELYADPTLGILPAMTFSRWRCARRALALISRE
jgi:hypothetical protein